MNLEVYIDPPAFLSLCTSAIETYNRECNGFLMGKYSLRTISHRRRRVAAITMAYPLQTAARKPSSVTHGNYMAYRRASGTMSALSGMRGMKLVGGYHSHVGGPCRLSVDDIRYVVEETTRMGNVKPLCPGSWLEIIVAIKKRQYSEGGRRKEPWDWHDFPRKVGCNVRTSRKTGYNITMGAFWVDRESGGSEETTIRVPWAWGHWS
jgi:proteasome lid subunit RPN8/RPN11